MNTVTYPARQSGAALVIALIMVLVMTMLGVSSVRTAVTGERMTGHFFNKQTSFDAAEAALRAGETASDGYALYATTDGTDGLYLPNSTGTPRWEDSGTTWQNRTSTTITGVAQQPQYISEYLGGVPRDDNCLLDADASTNQDCWRYAYRVSAQGWGANTVSSSMTQSTTLTRK